MSAPDGGGIILTARDRAFVAAAWKNPDAIRELGLPPNGYATANGRRVLEAIRDKGHGNGVLADAGLSVQMSTKVIALADKGTRSYAELLADPPPEPDRNVAAFAPRLCDVARLREREHLQFIPVADLPEGQGVGEVFDEATGGGLAPGSTIGIGAAGTGAGKSALLMQVLDGLALRCAAIVENPEATLPLTPVAIYSEMPSDMLENRTLGRLVGVSGHIFAAGRSARRFHAKSWVDDHFDRAAAVMAPGGAYHQIATWQRFTRAGKLAGPSLVRVIEQDVSAWVEELRRAHPGRDIVPIVALDPIDSFLSTDDRRSEIERMGEMIALMDELADRRGWIVIITVDTNKTSAIEGFSGTAGASGSLAAKVFRGTMALLHRLDLALVFDPGKEDAGGVWEASLLIDKNRTGPSGISIGLRWHKKTGLRFVPDTKAEYTKKVDAKRAKADPATQMNNLVAVVRDLTDPAKNLYATERQIRARVFDIGTTEKKLPALLTDAIKANRIRQSEVKKGQGGGKPYEVME
jgi:hypothetical protein